ncbi:MBL fold metallo-hydrolase [Mucilaginibacter rubeus]|uniref:MBL fold metallo-hydrolase n=1 Tax=Mucilaginibacter rubeus TaxID=2027860 RepID=A0AAE6MKH0_9SPHI|nr:MULTISPECIES: MBL fold metallo-hydrolase [Mucilaginibacter]QEM06725.1 MBL fold metallo-hydrolase [Mucilaginibacter rubeus]QEM19313.1 MBL fold metallo-hydrolase [Mucilaginibacter gossypii]QTE44143.1 MBL fold metallo-hydrolase [Mucilaginibacter rubeus]QTE50744.1 MBL fold metallo-hydrolase [Mucilaginibacter rubeus]QTE55826.1 MBL fold metallo-hydrolase [Mucilaginibacter rubeus]
MKSEVNVTYLGGPTIILEIGGLRLMTDPTLDPAGEQFMINDKPAYHKTEGPATTDIGKIDVVLLSHDQHGDNLDHAGRELLKQVDKTLTTKIGAERLGGNALGLAPWESIALNDEVVITGTPARHGPAGSEKLTGDVTGFIITIAGLQIYITGDTVFYDGVKEVAEKFKPQYVFIFAGAAKPRGPFNVTMGTNDAIDTAFAFPDATIIPVHFEGWSHYTETGEMLQQSFNALGIGGQLRILEPGVKTNL